MSDIPAYIVANATITDTEAYHVYEKGFFPKLKEYGGQFITFDDNSITLEGDSPREGRMIIFQFPSEEKAKAWYADAEYQALSEHRRVATKLEFMTLVHGQAPRS